MPSRRTMLPLLLAVIFVAGNAFNALHKGGDAQDFFEGGRRFLHAQPLYQDSSPASGFIGPPFQALFFLPFGALAARSDAAARLLWYAVNLVMLAVGVRAWTRAWTTGLTESHLGSVHRESSVWWALAAVLLPLQTNFEHQNMNALLLGTVGLAAWALMASRPVTAGVLIGFAAAIKVFPLLLVFYLAIRRLWAAAGVALATAVGLTVLPVVAYGGDGFVRQITAWSQLGSGGWPTRAQNQSLVAAVDRALPGAPVSAVHGAWQVPVDFLVFAVLAAALVLAGVAAVIRTRDGFLRPQVPCELAAALVLSVLLSPVAWDHYWVLMFPGLLLVRDASAGVLLGRRATAIFWTAAVLISGLSPITLGVTLWSVARAASVSTIASLLLYLTLGALSPRIAIAGNTSAAHGGRRPGRRAGGDP